MNLPGKRVLLGTAVATAALGVGGIAYATSGDPAPQQGYVTIEEGATTPSPDAGTSPRQGEQGGPSGRADGWDCPEKDGSGQGSGEGQGQAQPEQTQPEQSDPQGNA